MTTHLHWLYFQGPVALREVAIGLSLCGKKLVRKDLTTFLEDADCPRCLELTKEEKDHVSN